MGKIKCMKSFVTTYYNIFGHSYSIHINKINLLTITLYKYFSDWFRNHRSCIFYEMYIFTLKKERWFQNRPENRKYSGLILSKFLLFYNEKPTKSISCIQQYFYSCTTIAPLSFFSLAQRLMLARTFLEHVSHASRSLDIANENFLKYAFNLMSTY